MVDLTSAEESALRELVSEHDAGRSVREFVQNRLFHELSHTVDKGAGVHEFHAHPGYYEQRQLYDSLVDKGLLIGSRLTPDSGYRYGELTANGLVYLSDKAECEAAERERVRSERAHDWRIAMFGVLGGLFSGALGSWLFDLILGALTG